MMKKETQESLDFKNGTTIHDHDVYDRDEHNDHNHGEHDDHDHVQHNNHNGHNDHDDHDHGTIEGWRGYLPAASSFVLLIIGLYIEHILKASFFTGWIKIIWYGMAYIPVGLPVIREAWTFILRGDAFNEFFLMSIATIGAFAIGEYPEGVAVMLFYTVGELFQTKAVQKSRDNIKALLDVRPRDATVFRHGNYISVNPTEVVIGEIIQVKVGEKLPLDGTLLSPTASLNTAALTGESKPQGYTMGEIVMAGSINLSTVIDIEVGKLFEDSSMARILELVQNASSKKAKTELLIRKLAKIYTPIVVYLAIAICLLPYLFVDSYVFSEWLYRALVFLVISCPCALVISIPLGYFGGLGAASKNGILFKGATYLDEITKINTIVMDKTGTVTKGIFKIQKIQITNGMSEVQFMSYLLAIESKSTHPIAKALLEYGSADNAYTIENIIEIPGQGLSGIVAGKSILAGNQKLILENGITPPRETNVIANSIVHVAIDDSYAGYVVIADEIKEDAVETITRLRSMGINLIMMLSGDKESITKKTACKIGISIAKGNLLPEDKLQEVEQLKTDTNNSIAFIGDGINDAPVLAASDIGIAMGGLGSDVAIETADIIIQNDQLSKVITAIGIGKSTQTIIWQNIFMAFGVKVLVLILGAVGIATMWAAVFADVGVAFLAILNAIRLQHMKWN